MRFLRFATHAALAASLTALFYLGGPVGVAVAGGEKERVTVETLPMSDRPVTFVMTLPDAPDGEAAEASADAPQGAGDAAEASGPAVEGAGTRRVAAPRKLSDTISRAGGGGQTRGTSSKRRGQKCVEPTTAIRELEAGAWEVDRSFVDGYTRDWSRLNHLGRVYRHDNAKGKADGFLLKGIRCGSPLHQGGFRNGDVVHSVNGKPVHNLVQALAAYNKLQRKDNLRVDVTRDGAPVRLSFRIDG